MKGILLIGDVIINSSAYTLYNTEKILESKDIETDVIKIDSIYKIRPCHYIPNPIQYKRSSLLNLDEYNMIVLSIFSYDINNNYYSKLVIDNNYLFIYENIIIELRQRCKKLLVVFPHKPYLGEDSKESHYEEEINTCYSIYYKFLISMAKKYKFSILNLNKSFDCKKRDNYIYDRHIFITNENNSKIGSVLISIYNEINENSLYSI